MPEETANPTPTDAQILENLQNENAQLKARIDQLLTAQQDTALEAERLEQAEQVNLQLRRRLAGASLSQAMAEAAANVGLSAEAAAIYSHRFQCQIDDEGNAHIEPNPTEFLLKELHDNPLLTQAADRARQERQARSVIHGVSAADAVDSAELMAALDRDPGKKALFIRRHGGAALVDLSAKARREGYRN